MRKFLGRTCLALAATAVGLLLGEVVIRVLGLAPAFTSVPFGEYVVSDDPEQHQLHKRVAALARKAGFAVLDLAGPLREVLLSSDESLSLQGDIIHPNALGADVAARAIAIGIVGHAGK